MSEWERKVKGDLSHFECGMVVGARRASLSISQSAHLLGFPKGKTSSMWQYVAVLLMLEVRGEWSD